MTEKSAVFIAADRLGCGDDELGAALMLAALKNLAKLAPLPSHILLMNAGVRLCCEGSRALADLRTLTELGVEILACGTCLDWFELDGSLTVGKRSNMGEILGAMNAARNVIRL